MIAPLSAVPIRGFAWYQGEGDSTDNTNYARYLRDLIAAWRTDHGDASLPFLVVQITDYEAETVAHNPKLALTRALLREAQQAAVDATPATALIVSADVGNPAASHSRDKKTVGERLGLAARRLAYGETDLVDSGPRPAGFDVAGSTVKLRFENIGGGLVIDFKRASGTGPSFQLAGADGVFHDAAATLEGDQVVLSADAVKAPLQLYYGFHNNPHLILYNAEGLPAAPFRIPLSAAGH